MRKEEGMTEWLRGWRELELFLEKGRGKINGEVGLEVVTPCRWEGGVS